MKVNSFNVAFTSGSVVVFLWSVFFRFGEGTSERFEYCVGILDEVRLQENPGKNNLSQLHFHRISESDSAIEIFMYS